MPASRPFAALSLSMLGLAWAASPARAADPVVAPFELGAFDYAVIPVTAGLQGWAQYRYWDMDPAGPEDLDPGDLWGLDRWAAGNYSHAAALSSDALILPWVTVPLALSAWDAYAGRGTASGGWKVFLTEAAVYSEAMVFSSSLNLLVRSTRVHPRPFLYGSDAPKEDLKSGEASGSFYSGHANGAFAAATYLAYTYPLRHPEFEHQGLLWGGSLAMAATVASLRVAAGKHFPSDIVVGAAAGTFFGWAFPRLHLKAANGETRAQARLLPLPDGVQSAFAYRF